VSWQATAWAIEQQEVTDPITLLVLLCLANYADAVGANAFPSIDRLARDSRLVIRAVQYQLRKLEREGLIRRGNQAIAAAHICRADRRPIVYDLLMQRGAPHAPGRGALDAPREVTGCTETTNGVHEGGVTGCIPVHPILPLRSSLNIREESARANPTGSGAKPATKEEREAFKQHLRSLALMPLSPQQRKRP